MSNIKTKKHKTSASRRELKKPKKSLHRASVQTMKKTKKAALASIKKAEQQRKENKKLLVVISLVSSIVFLLFLGGISVYYTARSDEERNRDYFISIDSEVAQNCNLQFDSTNEEFYCAPTEIFGTFSDFESIELTTDGWQKYSFYKSYYETSTDTELGEDPFEIEKINYGIFKISFSSGIHRDELIYDSSTFQESNLDNVIEVKANVKLFNAFLGEDVARKDIVISVRLTDEEKSQILNKHTEWQEKKDQEKKEAEQRKAEDQAKKEAEERAKAKEEEKKRQEEAQRKAEEEEKKRQEEAQAQAEAATKIPDNKLYDAINACDDALYAQKGISAPMSVTNYHHGDWSGQDYVWMLNLWPKYKGSTIKVTCFYNWQTGSANITNVGY